MTDEQIKQSAEIYARYNTRANNTAYYAYIDGAHSRDEEVEQLKKAISSAQKSMAELAEIARHLWINASKQLPPENKEGSNLSIDCLVVAGDGNSFFYVIAWYDYSGKCWYEKYDFDQTHLDGNKVFYWMELPKCNHIEVEGGDK